MHRTTKLTCNYDKPCHYKRYILGRGDFTPIVMTNNDTAIIQSPPFLKLKEVARRLREIYNVRGGKSGCKLVNAGSKA